MVDPREARLPKWAQDELAQLRRELESVRLRLAELNAQHPSSNAHIVDYVHGDYGLPADSRVRFAVVPDDGRRRQSITVFVEDGQLAVHGDYPLSVNPRSSNTLDVTFRERW